MHSSAKYRTLIRLILLLIGCFPCGVLAQKGSEWKQDSSFVRGQQFAEKGAYDQALKYYLKVLKKNESRKNIVATSTIKNAIGLVYIRVGDYQLARQYLNASLALSSSKNDVAGMAHAYNNLGILAQNEHDYTLATRQYEKSLKLKRTLKDTIGISRTLCNLGTVEVDRKNYRSALSFYFESLSMKRAIHDSSGLAVIYANIGDAYGNLGVLDSTRFFLLKGLTIAEKLDMLPTLSNYYRNLGALFAEQDSFALAVKYQRLYILAQDSLFSSSLSEELAKQEVKFRVSAKQKELEISKSKNALLEKDKEVKLRNAQVLWGFLIALTVSVLLLVLLLKFRSRTILQERVASDKERELSELMLKNEQNQKRQLLREKEMVDRELLLVSMQTLKKQEMLSNLYEKVINDSRNKDINNKEILEATISQLKSNLNTEDDWENFKLYFEKVHPAFFATISEKFPELSLTDHRHMAYILIGLSTKEIARLMSITPESVQKSRVRLKKKLRLEKEHRLGDFIRSI